MKQCPDPACRLAWLESHASGVRSVEGLPPYYTHEEIVTGNGVAKGRTLKHAFDYARRGYLAWKLGYREAATWPQKLAGLLLYLHPGFASDDLAAEEVLLRH